MILWLAMVAEMDAPLTAEHLVGLLAAQDVVTDAQHIVGHHAGVALDLVLVVLVALEAALAAVQEAVVVHVVVVLIPAQAHVKELAKVYVVTDAQAAQAALDVVHVLVGVADIAIMLVRQLMLLQQLRT